MSNHLRFRWNNISFIYPPESTIPVVHVRMVWFPSGKIAFSRTSDFNDGSNRKVVSAVIFNDFNKVALPDFHSNHLRLYTQNFSRGVI